MFYYIKHATCYTLLFFIFSALYVQGQAEYHYTIKELSARESSLKGPLFQTTAGGITITASLPPTASNLDSIALTLRLINRSKSNLIIRDFGCLRGFNLHLEDLSHNELTRTTALTEALGDPGPNPALVGGFMGFTLKPGDVCEINLPLTGYISIPALGAYQLRVDWRQLEKPKGQWWQVPAKPQLQLAGTILLHQTTKGISISVAK
jgi:hypothetical protein